MINKKIINRKIFAHLKWILERNRESDPEHVAVVLSIVEGAISYAWDGAKTYTSVVDSPSIAPDQRTAGVLLMDRVAKEWVRTRSVGSAAIVEEIHSLRNGARTAENEVIAILQRKGK